MSQLFTAVTGGVPSNVPITFHTNGADATPAANQLTIVGAAGTTTAGSGSTITITTTATTFTWTDISADPAPALVNNGYFCTAALTITLPPSPTQGQVVIIECDTTGAVVVTANTGQFIRMGQTATSVAGTATSSKRGDTLYLVYRSASQTWNSISTEGTWALSP